MVRFTRRLNVVQVVDLEFERRALTESAIHFHLPTMNLDDTLRDHETKASPLDRFGVSGMNTVERSKHLFLIVFRNSESLVSNFEL